MNNTNNNNNVSGGVSFLGLLTIVFIVLKLVGVINWSWVWVLSPIWLSFLLGLVIIIVAAIIANL
jgi:hypothetical protein